MASSQDPKRARPGSLTQKHHPNKKTKSRAQVRRLSNFPPEFRDNLSKLHLTRRALRELDRRNRARPAPGPKAPAVYTSDLSRFARHGGPELRNLRAYLGLRSDVHTMASGSASTPTQSSKPAQATDVADRPPRTSVYDANLELHMIDYNIYPGRYEYPADCVTSEPKNLDELRRELLAARASLSLSQSPDLTFRDFKKKNNTSSKATVIRNVVTIIAGNSEIPNDGNLRSTNLKSVAGDTIVKLVPDFFDGALVADIHRKIRNPRENGNLNNLIVPANHVNAPVAPSFFLEVKALSTVANTAPRQAMHDGAAGARVMHALQNYGKEEPAFDGNAYAYSSVYHAYNGMLQLYAHHVTPPTASGGQPKYHMTQLMSYAMESDVETFIKGVTAFRNLRELAQRHRNNFIQTANARARQTDGEAPPEPEIMVPEDSTTDGFVDCEEYAGSHADGTKSNGVSDRIDEEPSVPQ